MKKVSHIDLLRRIPRFSRLTDAEAQALELVATKKRFKRNENVVELGQQTYSLFIILSGKARVTLADPSGRKLILAEMHAGDFIGEMSLIDSQPHSATVEAATTLDTLVLEAEGFKKCMFQNATITEAIMLGLVERMRRSNKKMGDLALVRVHDRVYGRLKEMAHDHAPSNTNSNSNSDSKKLSRSELARQVGASREMVSRVLRDFEKQAYIKQNPDGSISLLKPLS
jgi:CRP-like cAMP-binding protein